MFVKAFDITAPGIRPHSVPAGQWVHAGDPETRGRFVGVHPSGSLWVCWDTRAGRFDIMRRRLKSAQFRAEQTAIVNAHALIAESQPPARKRAAWLPSIVGTLLPWAATVALTVAPLLAQ